MNESASTRLATNHNQTILWSLACSVSVLAQNPTMPELSIKGTGTKNNMNNPQDLARNVFWTQAPSLEFLRPSPCFYPCA